MHPVEAVLTRIKAQHPLDDEQMASRRRYLNESYGAFQQALIEHVWRVPPEFISRKVVLRLISDYNYINTEDNIDLSNLKGSDTEFMDAINALRETDEKERILEKKEGPSYAPVFRATRPFSKPKHRKQYGKGHALEQAILEDKNISPNIFKARVTAGEWELINEIFDEAGRLLDEIEKPCERVQAEKNAKPKESKNEGHASMPKADRQRLWEARWKLLQFIFYKHQELYGYPLEGGKKLGLLKLISFAKGKRIHVDKAIERKLPTSGDDWDACSFEELVMEYIRLLTNANQEVPSEVLDATKKLLEANEMLHSTMDATEVDRIFRETGFALSCRVELEKFLSAYLHVSEKKNKLVDRRVLTWCQKISSIGTSNVATGFETEHRHEDPVPFEKGEIYFLVFYLHQYGRHVIQAGGEVDQTIKMFMKRIVDRAKRVGVEEEDPVLWANARTWGDDYRKSCLVEDKKNDIIWALQECSKTADAPFSGGLIAALALLFQKSRGDVDIRITEDFERSGDSIQARAIETIKTDGVGGREPLDKDIEVVESCKEVNKKAKEPLDDDHIIEEREKGQLEDNEDDDLSEVNSNEQDKEDILRLLHECSKKVEENGMPICQDLKAALEAMLGRYKGKVDMEVEPLICRTRGNTLQDDTVSCAKTYTDNLKNNEEEVDEEVMEMVDSLIDLSNAQFIKEVEEKVADCKEDQEAYIVDSGVRVIVSSGNLKELGVIQPAEDKDLADVIEAIEENSFLKA